MMKTVCISDVTKDYGRIQAVRGASFELGQGELVALIGHNGAGKTTLMKLMLGLIRPTSGSIEVLGDNPAAGQFAGPVSSLASRPSGRVYCRRPPRRSFRSASRPCRRSPTSNARAKGPSVVARCCMN